MKTKYKNWTNEQLSYLLTNYGKLPIDQISQEIKKPIGSIYYILDKEDINLKTEFWTKEEISYLEKHYPTEPNSQLRTKLLRSEDSIQLKAASLGLKKSTFWTVEEISTLSEMYHIGLSYKEMADILQRDISSIHYQLSQSGLTKDIRRWTDDEADMIYYMANANKYTYVDIALKLKADPIQINAFCIYHGLNDKIIKSSSRGEEMLGDLLYRKYGQGQVWRQFHIGEGLRLDFFVPQNNTGWEYDGIQHFKEIEIFKNDKENLITRKERDKRKNFLCEQLGIKLVRIPYSEHLNEKLIQDKISEISQLSPTPELEQIKKTKGKKSEVYLKNLAYKNSLKEKAKEARSGFYQKMKSRVKEFKLKITENK